MAEIRIGHGYDVHKLVEGRRLILGGVEIPFDKGLDGHSDADVLTHAVMDALLGAVALGDIGMHFPPSDVGYKDADSMELLKTVIDKIGAAGCQKIVNVDVTVIAEAPKLAPHIQSIRSRLAKAMSIGLSCMSVKATTTEGLGHTGRGEGIAAHAVCLVEKGVKPG